MATKLSSVKRSSYANQVGDYNIEYSIVQNNGEKAQQITANIKHVNYKRGDTVTGVIYANVDGNLNVNFNPGISTEDKIAVFSTCLTDITSIFDELNKE